MQIEVERESGRKIILEHADDHDPTFRNDKHGNTIIVLEDEENDRTVKVVLDLHETGLLLQQLKVRVINLQRKGKLK